MSNNATVENLNKALQMEMSAAHQYQLHAHVLDDWGLNLLADNRRRPLPRTSSPTSPDTRPWRNTTAMARAR